MKCSANYLFERFPPRGCGLDPEELDELPVADGELGGGRYISLKFDKYDKYDFVSNHQTDKSFTDEDSSSDSKYLK